MRQRTPFLILLLTLALVASSVAVIPGLPGNPLPVGPQPDQTTATRSAPYGTATDVYLVSHVDNATIAITVFRPAGADAQHPVPILLHGHGWGGSRWTNLSTAEPYLRAGYGVISIDMRGHGQSGGEARVMSPFTEARDVMQVMTYASQLTWSEKQSTHPNDTVLGTMGLSYGGGYQLITALEETRLKGYTRIDAMAPEWTWYNLDQSLAPNGVPRSEWIDALYWSAQASGTRISNNVTEAYFYSMATGDIPNGSVNGTPDIAQEFYRHSAAWYADHGIHLDVPALFVQGAPDTLFNLNQAYANLENTLTPQARSQSYLFGQLTGHVLPNAFPYGMNPYDRGAPCINRTFGAPTSTTPFDQSNYTRGADLVAGGGDALHAHMLTAWFNMTLKGETGQGFPAEPIMLATENGQCLHLAALPKPTITSVPGESPQGTPVPIAAGPPTYLEVPLGNVTHGNQTLHLAGIPTFSALVTTPNTDTRIFAALAVGPNPLQAHVVDNQWMPIHIQKAPPSPPNASPPSPPDPSNPQPPNMPAPPSGPQPVEVSMDLAGVVVDVPNGSHLYLVLAPTVDQFIHHGSRQPGGALFQNIALGLPVAPQGAEN